jgi:hypothetical protein
MLDVADWIRTFESVVGTSIVDDHLLRLHIYSPLSTVSLLFIGWLVCQFLVHELLLMHDCVCRSDIFIVVFVGLFSVASGYLSVLTYEVAASDIYSTAQRAHLTNILNLSFQVRVVIVVVVVVVGGGGGGGVCTYLSNNSEL